MRGQHGGGVGQFRGETARGGVLGAGQALGQARLDQVGAADRADQQRTSGEHRDLHPVLLKDVRGVVRGVTGRRQCLQREIGVDDRAVPVVHGYPSEGDGGPGRHEIGSAGEAGQFQAAGDVVVVDVGLDHM